MAQVRARVLRAARVEEEMDPVRNTRARSVAAGLLSLALLAGACGDDDDTDATAGDGESTETTESADTTAPEGEATDGEMTALDVTLTADGLEGVPEEFPGGAVEVSFTVDTEDEYASLDFTRVDEGTTVEQFAEEFVVVFEGGPFPDYVRSNAGVEGAGGETTTSTLLLEPGNYVVWYESESTGDEIHGTAAQVTEGSVTELPETDGEIVARDYAFDVDVSGPGTITFRNDGPDQLHHAVLIDFGTNTPEAARQAIMPLLQSEGEEAPDVAGFDMSQVNPDFGGSAVFGPGAGGTFEADFVAGNTYGVVCFISDRAGGPPHAIGMEMFEVFQV